MQRTYKAKKCPAWLSTVIADWVGWPNVDKRAPVHIVDVAAHIITIMQRERLGAVFLDRNEQETDQTFESLAALAELAENLRALGLAGDAEAVTLCELLLSKIENDLDWLDGRDVTANLISDACRSGIDWSKSARPWSAADAASMWAVAA